MPLLALADDSQWGDLSGQFLYDGDPPPAKTFRITKDQAVFGDTIQDESLLVNPDNGGIANILVYLLSNDEADPSVHPSYEASANAKVELAMQGGRFAPHVLLLCTSQTMLQCNKDQVGYNANLQFINNQGM